MPVRLRAIDEDELPAFIVRARETYERQLVELGRLDPVEAHNKVVADSERLFPRGRPAESVRLYWIEDEGSGLRVGNLFFAPAGAAGKVAYLYGLEIDEDERGKGFGRAAMLAFEQRARELGFRELRLNVFGGNEPARALYRSLGYEEVEIAMTKPISDRPEEAT